MSHTVRQRTLFVALSLFLMTAAFILTKTGRDALYFQGRGLFDLPWAYVAIAFFSLPTAFAMLTLMRHLGPRRARIGAPIGMSGIILLFSLCARPGGGWLMTSFFVLIPLAFGVLFSLAWLLGADLLEGVPHSALARSYGIVGAASILGGMAGGITARALSRQVEPQSLILLGAMALASAAAVAAVAQSRFPPAPIAGATAVGEPTLRDLTLALKRRYPLLLLAVGMLSSLVGILVEFQLYLAAATSGHDGRANAQFFGGVYLALNCAALAVQLYAMPRLQRAIGVHGSLLVLPAALLAGAATLLATATLFALSLLRVTEGGLKASIHRVNWEQAFLPLERAERAVAKLLVDGAGARIAEGFAAGALALWLTFVVRGRDLVGQDVSWITYALLVASLLWVGLTRVLARSLAQAASHPEEFRPDIPLPDT